MWEKIVFSSKRWWIAEEVLGGGEGWEDTFTAHALFGEECLVSSAAPGWSEWRGGVSNTILEKGEERRAFFRYETRRRASSSSISSEKLWNFFIDIWSVVVVVYAAVAAAAVVVAAAADIDRSHYSHTL